LVFYWEKWSKDHGKLGMNQDRPGVVSRLPILPERILLTRSF
jgi:hypothetical protein